MTDRPADGTVPTIEAPVLEPTPVTVPATEPVSVARRRGPRLPFGHALGGIAAIGAKELRGRMRGRRAFIIVTLYLSRLGGFAWMVASLVAQSFNPGFGGSSTFASAAIGQGIFAALLMLETLQVAFLAPSSTAGAISLEREKQTLELLTATPISSFSIVVGKLLSTLVYVFLLIAASIPLMAMVFVYGGVGPEDVVRGYIVLIATAIGLGSFGLFCSSVVKRTTAATAITIFGVLAVTIGTVFVLIFWSAMGSFDNNGNRRDGPLGIRSPEVLAYLNPFIAQADVLCGSETSMASAWCMGIQGLVPTQDGIVFVEGRAEPVPLDGPGVIVDDTGGREIAPAQPFGNPRDQLWPRSVLTWLVLSAIFLGLSIQLVSPTRRWRPARRRGSAWSPGG
jgi:ABC-type transport system involved in multi-copper enzyme maturation permease subunit